jgi:hypothetical protein
LIALLAALAASPATAAEVLRFEVLLDERPIGEHVFRIADTGGLKRVSSRAAFDVDFLMFTAYRYRHRSSEVFDNGCLTRIDATTDDNGTRYRVEGATAGDRLRIRRDDGVERADGCVKTFAYWDPSILTQDRLLNPQTGELETVRVRRAGRDQVEIEGRRVAATRYALATDDLTIDLWYNDDLGWVRLASDTGKGARLIYRRL